VRAVRINSSRGELREVYVGTGVVFEPGWVVTTPSVVAAGVSYSVQAAGTVPVPAELVGHHADAHTAVFRAPQLDVPAAEFGSDSTLMPGQLLMVLGNAFGLEASVSWGLAAGARDDGLWQIGVNVAPGASGSPVANTAGQVIGLVVAALSEAESPDPSVFGGSAAIMVPASRALPMAHRIAREGSVGRAFLGIRPQPVETDLARALGLTHGVLVGAVSFGSPAYAAGLRAGDIIIEIDERSMPHEQSLRQTLAERCPGEEVRVSVVRNHAVNQFKVRLGQAPEILPERPAAKSALFLDAASSQTGASRERQAVEDQIRQLEERLEALKRELEERP
jgi:S1-C subfamily serine protease